MKKILYFIQCLVIPFIAMSHTTLNATEILVIQDGQQMKATDSGVTNINDFNNQTCINSVWSYNTELLKWEIYSPIAGYVDEVTEDGTVNELFIIAPNTGFWVVSNDGESCEITITTVANSSQSTLETVQGWNLYGSKKEFLNMESFNKNTVNIVWSYNLSQNRWGAYSSNPLTAQKIIDNADVTTLTTINPQDGFWIHTTEATSIKLPNTAPVADAGLDTIADLSSIITLSANGSYDIDNNTLTYLWSLVSKPTGSTATLTNETEESLLFHPDIKGSYTFKLIVNDGVENSVEDSITIDVVESELTFDSTEGWGSNVYNYDGIKDTNVIIKLPVGTYNIFAEIADGNSDVKAVIGTLYDQDLIDITQTDLVGVGSFETIVNSPANITIKNDSGAEKTYILPILARSIENNNQVIDKIALTVVDANQNSYPQGGELAIGNVTTNTLMMLGIDESHTWYFTALASGTYTLSVSTDATVNKLMQFNIQLIPNGNVSELVSDSTEVGSFLQENITLESGVSYLVKIGTTVMQWDTIGKYTIRLVKD